MAGAMVEARGGAEGPSFVWVATVRAMGGGVVFACVVWESVVPAPPPGDPQLLVPPRTHRRAQARQRVTQFLEAPPPQLAPWVYFCYPEVDPALFLLGVVPPRVSRELGRRPVTARSAFY